MVDKRVQAYEASSIRLSSFILVVYDINLAVSVIIPGIATSTGASSVTDSGGKYEDIPETGI